MTLTLAPNASALGASFFAADLTLAPKVCMPDMMTTCSIEGPILKYVLFYVLFVLADSSFLATNPLPSLQTRDEEGPSLTHRRPHLPHLKFETRRLHQCSCRTRRYFWSVIFIFLLFSLAYISLAYSSRPVPHPCEERRDALHVQTTRTRHDVLRTQATHARTTCYMHRQPMRVQHATRTGDPHAL
jgi:hypothetical protein